MNAAQAPSGSGASERRHSPIGVSAKRRSSVSCSTPTAASARSSR